MRELKFRANDTIGNFIYSDDFDSLAEYFEDCDLHGWKDQEQYINKLDIDQNEIYEGDKVESITTGFIFVILFDDEDLCFKGILNDLYYLRGSSFIKSKIIGHIHEATK